MARWAGWGAGPSGAGAAGSSRGFLGAAAIGSAGLAVLLAADGGWIAAGAVALAAVYFGLRLIGALGRGGSER